VSPKLSRLLFVAAVVTGASAPMLGAQAAGQSRSVDAWNPPRNFEVPGAADTRRLEINKDDTVSWVIWEGEHTVTPKDSKQWGGTGSDDTLTPESARYSKSFKTPGDYVYFCSLHGGVDEDNKMFGMWGVIHVIDPNANTPPPPPPPPPPTETSTTTTSTTVTTRPGATPPATSATAPTTRPTPTTAAPTTTTAKGDKNKKPKEEETTTTTLPPPPPPIDLPDEAIVPSLPGASTPASAEPGVAPTDTPEGEAVALLKGKKNGGGDAVKLLIVSGIGLGALGFGTAGYKYANRSSKYFPA